MGYYVEMTFNEIVIPSNKVKAALKTINGFFKDQETIIKNGGGGSSHCGGKTTRSYSWVNYPEGGFKSLVDAFAEWRYESNELDNGDHEVVCFTGEKLGDCHILWNALAKYIGNGSIDCRGEDGALWRWEIKDGKFKELSGKVTYE
jgi:hypothetical protein